MELTIVAQTPAHRDSNVSVLDPIRVTFSEAVQPGEEQLVLTAKDGVPIPATTTLSSDARTLTIEPVAPQKAPSEVVAHFGDIRALDGRGLASKPDWSWKLPAWVRIGSSWDKLVTIAPFTSSLVAGPGKRIAVSGRTKNGESVATIDSIHGEWKVLGGALYPEAYATHLALEPGGRLVAASVRDPFGDGSLRVQRWSGTEWARLGDFPDTIGHDTKDFSLAAGADGKLFLAYHMKVAGQDAGGDLIVRAFDGTNWQLLGGPVNDVHSEVGFSPSLAVDAAGAVYVCYRDPFVHVRKWTGRVWAAADSNFAPNGESATSATIAFDDRGELFAVGAFMNPAGGIVRALRFDGSKWVLIGDAMTTRAQGYLGAIAGGRDGHVFALVTNGLHHVLQVADITRAGWTKLEWPVDGLDWALSVDADNVPIVGADYIFRLNR